MTFSADAYRHRLQAQSNALHSMLTSGDPDKIAKARAVLELRLASVNNDRSLLLLDDLKRWINQPLDVPEARGERYYKKLLREAKTVMREAEQSWKEAGRAARALFYLGRFQKAWRAYSRALDGIESQWRTMSPEDQAIAQDVRASFAEMKVYLGFPHLALADLRGRPVEAWHKWVQAFAFHGLGFLSRFVPLREESGREGESLEEPYLRLSVDSGNGPRWEEPVDELPWPAPGSEEFYRVSNDLVEAAKADLPGDEAKDIELLRLANWGAIARRREALGEAAGREVEDGIGRAMGEFQSASATSSNRGWSWEKEMRGRLPLVHREHFDGRRGKRASETWRLQYREHYRLNLERAGIEPFSPIPDEIPDGWIDPVDDHDDDL